MSGPSRAADRDDGGDVVAQAQAALEDADVALRPHRRYVKEARLREVHGVLLRTSFERRAILWRHQPTDRPEPVAEAPSPPEPWSIAIDAVRDEGGIVREEHSLAGHAVVVRCPACGGGGRGACGACQGQRVVGRQVADRERGGTTTHFGPCDWCRGSGVAGCRDCGETGRALATPHLLVEKGTALQARTVDDGGLPTEVFVELVDVPLGGAVIFAEEGLAITHHHAAGGGAGGYRDGPAALPERVIAAIDALLAEDPVGGDWRTQRRVLEVRALPAYEVVLENGRTAWLVGDPARMVPGDALEGSGGVLGWLASRLTASGA